MEKLSEKLNIGIQEVKNIKMTALEKKRVWENILNSPVIPTKPVKSPYVIFSFISQLQKNRLVYYGIVPCLIIFLSGGGTFASQRSLPGDILYSLKVRVVEPIHSAFIISPESKAQHVSNLATKRLVEAETLAIENRLDVSKGEILSALLTNHTVALNKAIDESIEKGVEEDKSEDIMTNFQATMNAHASVLEFISEQESEQEKIVDTKISETARDNAEKVTGAIGDKTPEDYEEKKNVVQSLIEQTTTELNLDSDDISPARQKIMEDTEETLEEAKQFLKEGDEEDQEGDTQNAYSNLLNSESSAKEAGIFLKTSLELEEKN